MSHTSSPAIIKLRCLSACSVHSFQAASVAISGTTAVEADRGGWVHFGAAHFSLMMLVSIPSPAVDEEDIPSELHIEYGEWGQGSSRGQGCLDRCAPSAS